MSESDNEDDTIEQINARTRDALSSMIRKDVKKNLLDHDPKTKMSRSEYKEQERTSKRPCNRGNCFLRKTYLNTL
jgi:hypothetical protein